MFGLLLLSAGILIASPEDLELVELFRADTPADLEAAISDGYPMPWLAEILADSTILEEDRYWLDCRMRAAIARDLHVFFDREGNRVEVECDFLHPGENYWREHFIVNPPGESFRYDAEDRPSDLPYFEGSSQPGYILDLYGSRVGDIAITRDRVWLSRDASVGVFRTGSSDGMLYDHACFLYPDGSFREQPIDPIFEYYSVSEDGHLAAFYSMRRHEEGSDGRMLYVFDGSGALVFEKLMPKAPMSGPSAPAISPDNRFIAVAPGIKEVWLLDAVTGEEIFRWGGGELLDDPDNFVVGSRLTFSPDSRFLCITGSLALVVDCETGERVFFEPTFRGSLSADISQPDITSHNGYTSNDASIISLQWNVQRLDESLYVQRSSRIEVVDRSRSQPLFDQDGPHQDLYPTPSPNGLFIFFDSYNARFFGGPATDAPSTPISVLEVVGD